MVLSDHDLRQIDAAYLKSLPADKLGEVSLKLLQDLKEARERLKQTAQNSSRPSGSYAPWEGGVINKDEGAAAEPGEKQEVESSRAKKAKVQVQSAENKRKPGRQKGAAGQGRKVKLEVTGVEIHRAEQCSACGGELGVEARFEARTGLYVVDLELVGLGIQVTHVKHVCGDSQCECGHVTRTEPGRCAEEKGWQVELTEWHVVGPTLVALIVCLSLRLRLSRGRIQEFLQDWLQIELSVGTINQAILAGGRAVAPLEEELIAAVKQAGLVHIDETGWKEKGRLCWLWVLKTTNVTLFLIGRRSWEVIAAVLEGFAGWLMSDGYQAYRHYAQRLRCLAHLIRKAQGLSESLNQEAQLFGLKVLEYFTKFITGICRAREGPVGQLKTDLADPLAELKTWCEQHRASNHQKTRQLARELLNDWEAIWAVLDHPELPMTNNVAERALRHWVIARKISHGTRTPQGSRAFALLARVIETCRQRHILPWPYLAAVIAARRKGQIAPPLPIAAL